jgi:hypothetical protein
LYLIAGGNGGGTEIIFTRRNDRINHLIRSLRGVLLRPPAVVFFLGGLPAGLYYFVVAFTGKCGKMIHCRAACRSATTFLLSNSVFLFSQPIEIQRLKKTNRKNKKFPVIGMIFAYLPSQAAGKTSCRYNKPQQTYHKGDVQ